MSFKIFSIRKDLRFHLHLENNCLEYFIYDPIVKNFFQVEFLNFHLLKFFQSNPSSSQEASKFLLEKFEIEVSPLEIEIFLKNALKQGFLEPSYDKVLTQENILEIIKVFKKNISISIKKFLPSTSQVTDEKKHLLLILNQLKNFNVYGALSFSNQAIKENPKSNFLKEVFNDLRNTIIQVSKDKSVQERHLRFMKKWEIYNPDSLLEKFKPFIFAITSPVSILFLISLWIFSYYIAWKNRSFWFSPIQLTLFSFHHFYKLWILWFLNAFFHEFGHAILCYRFGGKVYGMGFFFTFGVIPSAYADVSSSYLFSKAKRVLVILGGILSQQVVFAFSMFFCFLTPETSVLYIWLKCLAFHNFLSGFLGILFPSYKSDGYYFLTEITGIKNLNDKTFSYFSDLFQKLFLKQTSSPKNSFIPFFEKFFVYYYGFFNLFFSVLPFLIYPIILIVFWRDMTLWIRIMTFLMFFSLFLKFISWFSKLLVSKLKKINSDGFLFSEIFKNNAVFLKKGFLLVAIFLFFLVPIPSHQNLNAKIIPSKEISLKAEIPGIVSNVFVNEGDSVLEKQPLVQMENILIEKDYQKLIYEIEKSLAILREITRGPSKQNIDVINRKISIKKEILKQKFLQHQRLQKAKNQNLISMHNFIESAEDLEKERKLFSLFLTQQLKENFQFNEILLEKKINLEMLFLQLSSLKTKLVKKDIFSPISGIITTKNTKDLPSKFFNEGEELIKVSSKEKMIEFFISENEIIKISKKQEFLFSSYIKPLPFYKGKVFFISENPIQNKESFSEKRKYTVFPFSSEYRILGKIEKNYSSKLFFETSGTVLINFGSKPLGRILLEDIYKALKINFWSTV